MPSNREETQHAISRSQPDPSPESASPVGYGLPCANCRKYYAADLPACPTCHATQRIGTSATATKLSAAQTSEVHGNSKLATPPRAEGTNQEQACPATQPIAAEGVHTCSNQRKSDRPHAPATVCKQCFEETKDRMNGMEAALHMDLREATQIIYEAVWADTSDPNKSYQNAAQALLTELRKRAGVTVLLGPIQLLPH